MIPLAQWLEAEEASRAGPASALSVVQSEPQFEPGPSREAEVEEAYERGRTEASAESEAHLASVLAEHDACSAVREAELIAQWSSRFATEVANELATALTMMRQEIESALQRVLEPFLVSESARKLISILLRTIDDELAGTGQLPIEIAAPQHLHDPLRSQCEQRGWSMPLTESPEIRVAFRGGLLRFDEMSAQWSAAVKDISP
jgi:hypothetical protein